MDTTSTLSQTMQTFYEKTFLERAKEEQVYEQGAQTRTQPKNNGKTVRFTRFAVPAVVTSALTEGTNPSVSSYTAVNVDATFAEYGNSWKLSRFLSLTSIDANNQEKIEIAGQNMGESRDARIRNELVTGSTLVRPSGASSDITTTSAMKLDAAAIRLLQAKLKKNKAIKYRGKYGYKMKAGNEALYDLSSDQIFIDFQANNADGGKDMLQTNKIGAVYNTEIWESTQPTVYTGVGASGIDLFANIIHGDHAFGTMDLEGDQMQIYIVPNTKVDSGNPAGRFGFISWAGSEANKTLNSNWMFNFKTAGSAL